MTKEKTHIADHILEKMEAKEKICYTCKHFIENRIPEAILKYGMFSGDCTYNDTENLNINDELSKRVIVMGDSVCEKWDGLLSYTYLNGKMAEIWMDAIDKKRQ